MFGSEETVAGQAPQGQLDDQQGRSSAGNLNLGQFLDPQLSHLFGNASAPMGSHGTMSYTMPTSHSHQAWPPAEQSAAFVGQSGYGPMDGHQSWPTSFSAAHSQPQQAWGSYNQPISLQNLGHYPHADFNSHSSTSDVQQQVHADIMGFAFGQQPGLPAAQQQQAGPSSDRLNVYPGNIDPTILMHSSRSFVADSSLANALGDLGRQQPPESSLSAMSGGVQYNAPTAAPQFTTTPNERPQPDGPSLTQTQMESVTKSVREKGDPVVELSLPTQHRSVSPRDSSSLPHTARALLDETYVRQHPEKAARGLIETLSTANVPGKLPPHGAPSSKDVSVRATNPKQRQDIITGMRQNATKSYLRTWIESPLGRRILVSWLADTLPPKKLGDDEDDPSAQWSKTLLPLLNILDAAPVEMKHLAPAEDGSLTLGKHISAVAKRARSQAARDRATAIKDRWARALNLKPSNSASTSKLTGEGSPNPEGDASKKRKSAEPAFPEASKRTALGSNRVPSGSGGIAPGSSGTAKVPPRAGPSGATGRPASNSTTSTTAKLSAPSNGTASRLVGPSSKVPARQPTSAPAATKADRSFFGADPLAAKKEKLFSLSKKTAATAPTQSARVGSPSTATPPGGTSRPSINTFEDALAAIDSRNKPDKKPTTQRTTAEGAPVQTKRKTVRWAADDQLEKIKLIEVISYGDEHNHSLVMQGTGGLDNAEGHMFKVHNLEMLEVLDWYAPKAVAVPPNQNPEAGSGSAEATKQDERESARPGVVYFDAASIPESPQEPDAVPVLDSSEAKEMQLGPEVAPFNFDGNTADQSKVQLLLQQLKAGGADEGQAAAAIANMTPKQQADLNSSSQSASSTQPKSLEELLGGIDHNLVQSLLNGVSGAGTGTGVVSALPSSAEHPHQVAVASSAPGHPAWGAPGPDSAHGWGQHQPAQAGYGDYSNGHGHPNQWGANDPSGYGSNQPPSWGGGGYGGPMGAPGGGTSSLPTPLGIPTEPFRDRPPSGPNHRGGGRHGLKTCRFYKTEAGCRRGDQCIFAHID